MEGSQERQRKETVALNGGLFKGTANGENYGRSTGAVPGSRVRWKCKGPGEKQDNSVGTTKGKGRDKTH
jgi:hypothetical protein